MGKGHAFSPQNSSPVTKLRFHVVMIIIFRCSWKNCFQFVCSIEESDGKIVYGFLELRMEVNSRSFVN